MLFRKDIERVCRYCKHSWEIDEEHMACIKKGVVNVGDYCKNFSYDALKREPPETRLPDFSKFSDEDFTL